MQIDAKLAVFSGRKPRLLDLNSLNENNREGKREIRISFLYNQTVAPVTKRNVNILEYPELLILYKHCMVLLSLDDGSIQYVPNGGHSSISQHSMSAAPKGTFTDPDVKIIIVLVYTREHYLYT